MSKPIRAAPLPPDLNTRIQSIVLDANDVYDLNLHSISDPGFVFDSAQHTPNHAVNSANDYIKVAGNISQIPKYAGIPGVKNAVNAIHSAANKFNTYLDSRGSKTIKANVIPEISGGGKRKRSKKIGTKKKQYKRK